MCMRYIVYTENFYTRYLVLISVVVNIGWNCTFKYVGWQWIGIFLSPFFSSHIFLSPLFPPSLFSFSFPLSFSFLLSVHSSLSILHHFFLPFCQFNNEKKDTALFPISVNLLGTRIYNIYLYLFFCELFDQLLIHSLL